MSKPSYDKIDYTLRPSKNIERKMIVETFARMRAFFALESYRYIGLGSPYFVDFSLVHRTLGIRDMLCIEKETGDEERFQFNRPFESIELQFGPSTEILPKLQWRDRPTILWLDYDDPIDSTMLSDIDLAFSSLATGSFFLVTMRSTGSDFGSTPSDRLSNLTESIGNKVPAGTSPADTGNSVFGRLLWRIIDAEIRYKLSERSAGLPKYLKFGYQQVLHFRYSDGTPMITVGGVVHQEAQRTHLNQCDFQSLPFSRSDRSPYEIKVLPLTFKERRAIDAHMPGEIPQLPGVPVSHTREYARHYRYFPNFVDAEI